MLDLFHCVVEAISPVEVICIRRTNTITIICIHLILVKFLGRNFYSQIVAAQFPIRNIQIILRLYKSPAEILAGFDIDCACFGYDGKLTKFGLDGHWKFIGFDPQDQLCTLILEPSLPP